MPGCTGVHSSARRSDTFGAPAPSLLLYCRKLAFAFGPVKAFASDRGKSVNCHSSKIAIYRYKLTGLSFLHGIRRYELGLWSLLQYLTICTCLGRSSLP